MTEKDRSRRASSNVLRGSFARDLNTRRTVVLDLPEFLLCAIEARVAEANEDAAPEERCTLEQCIETELVNLVTVRDVAELDAHLPGFADAVHAWVMELRE